MKKKVKVLLGIEAAEGGSLKHVVYLAGHLSKSVFEVTVILSKRSHNDEDKIIEMRRSGINVIEMPMVRKISPYQDMLSFIKVFTFLRKNKFEIVHAHSSKAGFLFRIAAFLTQVPVIVYTPHCFYFFGCSGFKRKWFEQIERALGWISDVIVVSSNEKHQCMRGKLFDDQKLVPINNAIKFEDYTFHNRDRILKSLGIKSNTLIIGTVGRLVKQKNLNVFIQVACGIANKFKHVQFVVAGAGDQYESLLQTVHELGLENRFIFTNHHPKIEEIFSVIDIFVSTSLWEGLPYVLLEAMWYKNAIVAYDVGYQGVIEDLKNGFVIKECNEHEMEKRIVHLLLNDELRKLVGARNHSDVVRKFSFSEFIRHHELLYLKLLEKKISLTGRAIIHI